MPLERVHESSVESRCARRVGVLRHLVIHCSQLRERRKQSGRMDRHEGRGIFPFLFLLYSFCRPFPLTWDNLLTLASNCSISTDMVSNILSWVELFSRGVVSDLKGKIRWKNIKNFYLKQLICNWFLTHIKKILYCFLVFNG